ncbi:MAG: tetratricopeptide repeat protein, partial [Planctomycetota bacterium]
FYLQRGELWREIGEPQLAESDFDEALRLIDVALREEPKLEAFNLRDRAFARYTKGLVENAITDLDEAIAKAAENPSFRSVLLTMRGMAWRRLGDLDKAEADFAYALEFDPENATAFSERGRLHIMRADFAIAIADFDKSIRLNPKHPILYASRAYANLNLHEYEKAILDCSEAINIFPLYAPAYRHRGCAHVALGQIDRALEDLNQAVRFTPNYVKPTVSGRELDPKRGPRERIYYYDFLPQLDRAGIWRMKGEWEKAIVDLKETLRMDPASTQAQNDLAWIQATCPDAKYRDGKSAIELARKACEATKWKKDDFIVTLAAAHAENSEYDEAIKRLTQANEIDPKRDAATRENLLKHFNQSMPFRDSAKDK